MRFLPFVIQFFLLVWALIDCVQTDEGRVRNLPKAAWVALVILVPFAGPIGWFLAGRPARELERRRETYLPYEAPRGPRPLAPDDDPAFLAKLEQRRAAEHEELLQKWEDDLRRREERLRREEGEDDRPDPAG